MAQYDKVDFPAIKQYASDNFHRIFDMLGLEMFQTKNGLQWRGPCPVCKRGDDRVLVYTPALKSWACHGGCTPDKGKKVLGGDLIRLVAHVRGINQPDAARLIRNNLMREPEKPKRKYTKRRTADPKPAKPVGGTEKPPAGNEDYSIVDYLQQFGG